MKKIIVCALVIVSVGVGGITGCSHNRPIDVSRMEEPGPDILLGEALEGKHWEAAGKICITCEIKDPIMGNQCRSLFSHELRHNLGYQIQYLLKNQARYNPSEVAVLTFNIWLDTPKEIYAELPFDMIYTLRQSRLGLKVLETLKNDSLPAISCRSNSKDCKKLKAMRKRLLAEYRAGKELDTSELRTYSRILHRVLSKDLSAYRAVYDTQPDGTAEGLSAWLLTVPAGLYVGSDDEAGNRALNEHLSGTIY